MTQQHFQQVAAFDMHDSTRANSGPDAPIWWAAIMLVIIELTVLATLIASYFYLSFASILPWPPTDVTLPAVVSPTISLGLMLASAGTMFVATRGAARDERNLLLFGIGSCVVLATGALGLRLSDIAGLDFLWSDHAYGSMVWLLLGFHVFHLVTAILAASVVTVLTMLGEVTPDRQVGVQALSIYWYYVVAGFVPVYLTVFWAPRWSGG